MIEINSLDDIVFRNDKTPKTGSILIANPLMPDPNFRRTVIIVVEHSNDFTLGFIINRQLELFLNDVLTDFPYFEAPLFLGGPVKLDTLHFVHRIGNKMKDTKPLGNNIFWGGDIDILRELIEAGEVQANDCKFFLGYSGWAPTQLTQELATHSWLVLEPQENYIFDNNDEDLWKSIMLSLGGNYAIMANYPEDPRDN